MLTEGRVSVDGTIVHKAKHIVNSGSEVTIGSKKKEQIDSQKSKQKIRKSRIKILFEDNEILVVNKQAGLLSVATNKMEPDTLHSRVLE